MNMTVESLRQWRLKKRVSVGDKLLKFHTTIIIVYHHVPHDRPLLYIEIHSNSMQFGNLSHSKWNQRGTANIEIFWFTVMYSMAQILRLLIQILGSTELIIILYFQKNRRDVLSDTIPSTATCHSVSERRDILRHALSYFSLLFFSSYQLKDKQQANNTALE